MNCLEIKRFYPPEDIIEKCPKCGCSRTKLAESNIDEENEAKPRIVLSAL